MKSQQFGGRLARLTPLLLCATLSCGPANTTPSETVRDALPPADIAAITVSAEHAAVATAKAVRLTTSSANVEQAPPVVDYDALVDAEWAEFPCSKWAGEAIAAGWSVEQMPTVLHTMRRESGCDPAIRSSTSDSGLMQINDIVLRDWRFIRDWPGFDPTTLFDANVNLRVALWLWGIDGWQPWGVGG